MDAKRRWEDEHWFWRGFQSAVFLYAQCGPCIAWRDNRRQKKQYKREKKERARDSDHPNLIRQPAPHEINPHWEEEIRLGPAPPKKGRKRGNTKASRDTASSGTLVASDTAGSSMSDLAAENKDKAVFWNSRRYQRADEEFAYVDAVDERQEMVYAPPGLHRRGSSVGVSGWVADSAQLPQKPKKAYTPSATMPPVNELHPPVVSSVPARRDERAWMKAPPPSAAFMHGKKGVTTRSRSGSGNSSLKNPETNLGRQVGQKLVEEKLKNAENTNYAVEVQPISERVDSKLEEEEEVVQPLIRQRSSSTSSFRLAREKQPSPSIRQKRRPTPLRLNTDKSIKSTSTQNASDAESEASSVSHESSKERGRARASYLSITKSKMSARSALNSHPISPGSTKDTATSTSIVSPRLSPSSTLRPQRDSATPTPLSASPRAVDEVTPSPRKRKDTKTSSDGEAAGPLLVKDSSLHILQDVVDTDALLNSKWIRSPIIEARIPLPEDDSPRKENESPIDLAHASAKEQLLVAEGARRWSWGM